MALPRWFRLKNQKAHEEIHHDFVFKSSLLLSELTITIPSQRVTWLQGGTLFSSPYSGHEWSGMGKDPSTIPVSDSEIQYFGQLYITAPLQIMTAE